MDGFVAEALERKKKGDFQRAISLIEEAIKAQGETPFLLSHLGHCFFLAGDLLRARELIEKSLDRDPKNPYALSFLARVAEREGKTKEQIEILSDSVSISPGDVHLRVALVWALVKSKKAKGAITHAKWLSEKASNNLQALKVSAVVFRNVGLDDEAKTVLKKMLAINPNDGFALQELLKMTASSEDDKLREIERLLKLPANRENRELLFMRVKLKEKLGDMEGAISAAEAAAEFFSDDKRVKFALVQLFNRAGRHRDAFEVLAELLKITPADLYLHNALAKAANEGGFLEDAYAFYTKLIRVHPNEKRLFGWRRRIQQRLEEKAIEPAENSEPIRTQSESNILAELKRFFGYDSLRPGQKDVIGAVVDGRHCLAVMPTGCGKSLCFQLPALMREGLAVVVSPLIALMKDQVDDLGRRGILAAALNSSISAESQDEVMAKAVSGALKFLYVAPERLRVASFAELLPRLNPTLFVIDEAHCISEWGHDFRPDYLKIGRAITACGAKQIVAMTATATPDVQRDIVRQLGLGSMHTYVTGFERPNLSFTVTKVSGDGERESRLIELFSEIEGSAIVYAASRKKAEEAADLLVARGIKARAYHAGMEHDDRIAVQDAFMKGDIRAIAATNAFGMGIDKSDIRLVVHYQMPGSIEAYYQEAGRAGRDGKPSCCELLFTFADKHIQEFFIDGSNPSLSVIRGVYGALLGEHTDMVELSARSLAARVGEASDFAAASALSILERMDVIERCGAGEALGRIDIREFFFLNPPKEGAAKRRRLWQWIRVESGDGDRRSFDVSVDVIAKELAFDVDSVSRGLRALADDGLIDWRPPFRGRAVVIRKRLKPESLPIDEAALKEKRRRDERKLSAMINYATSEGCRQSHIVHYFGGTSKDCAVCDICRGEIRTGPKKPATESAVLFEKLRAWRLDQSRHNGVPAFCILSDRSISSIAASCPKDTAALSDCFGIGRTKLEKYGREILEIIQSHSPE